MRERLVLVVEAGEAGDVEHPVVHSAALALPGHGVEQRGEQVVGSGDPAGLGVDPRTLGQGRAVRGEVEQAHATGVGVEQADLQGVEHRFDVTRVVWPAARSRAMARSSVAGFLQKVKRTIVFQCRGGR